MRAAEASLRIPGRVAVAAVAATAAGDGITAAIELVGVPREVTAAR